MKLVISTPEWKNPFINMIEWLTCSNKHNLLFGVLFITLTSTGCTRMISSATQQMAENLNRAILNSDDPETIKQGLPTYLIFMDSLLIKNPDDANLYQSAADLYSAYASAFIVNTDRKKRFSNKSVAHAKKAFCLQTSNLCHKESLAFDEFKNIIDHINKEHVSVLYSLGSALAGWVEANSDNVSAIPMLSRIELIMNRVIKLDEKHKDGSAHMYLGVLKSLIPASMGGKPEIGQTHFEKALSISKGRNLMVKVLYAKHYARLLFDRPLHDRLLSDVVSTKAAAEGFTLINQLAKQQARQLLTDADDYF